MTTPDPLALALACAEAFSKVNATILAADADPVQLAARARVGASLALISMAADIRRVVDLMDTDTDGDHVQPLGGM